MIIKADKQRLRRQAHRLMMLGIRVERERSKLKKLIERGASFDDLRVVQALERFQAVDFEWRELEAVHLQLRLKLGIEI